MKNYTCNICLKEKKLTWDHVPPKGSITRTLIQVQNYFYFFTNQQTRCYKSKSGIKFKTLCRECNSIIGAKYDVQIKNFAHNVENYLKHSRIITDKFFINCQPIAIAKGILSHILAAKTKVDQNKFDEKIRSFIFNDSIPIDNDIFIYFWIYPYKNIIIQRDFVITNLNNPQNSVFSQIIKYFPIAYWVTDKKLIGPPELTQFRDLLVSDYADVPIDFNYRLPQFAPEQPAQNQIIVLGQEGCNSIIATPKSK
ncbi:MAG TPA: hypothetical protein PLP19_07915 [bacterium]|nr:hypothetical protein [bacterium]HPN43399.1 hypothetical protein [bacterium]